MLARNMGLWIGPTLNQRALEGRGMKTISFSFVGSVTFFNILSAGNLSPFYGLGRGKY